MSFGTNFKLNFRLSFESPGNGGSVALLHQLQLGKCVRVRVRHVIGESTDMFHLPMWVQWLLSSHFFKIGRLPYSLTEELLCPLLLFVMCPRDRCFL